MMEKMQDKAVVINLNVQFILACVKIKNNNKRRKQMEQNEELKKALNYVIEGIKSGTLFDSHYIIDELRKNYPGIYKSNKTGDQDDAKYHGVIARKIKGIHGIIKISDVKISEFKNENVKVLSLNINNNESPNQLWAKFTESENA